MNQLGEGDVAKIELPGDADHVAVEPLLGEGVVGDGGAIAVSPLGDT